jgi:putative ABC transport system permease protein
MILWESAFLGFIGGIVGVALGVVGVNVLKDTPSIRGLLEPELTFNLMLIAVALAVVVGVLSGLYPAWRSSRLAPGRALR